MNHILVSWENCLKTCTKFLEREKRKFYLLFSDLPNTPGLTSFKSGFPFPEMMWTLPSFSKKNSNLWLKMTYNSYYICIKLKSHHQKYSKINQLYTMKLAHRSSFEIIWNSNLQTANRIHNVFYQREARIKNIVNFGRDMP